MAKKTTVVLLHDPAVHGRQPAVMLEHHCNPEELKTRLTAVVSQFVRAHPEANGNAFSHLVRTIPNEYFAQQTLTRLDIPSQDWWILLEDSKFNLEDVKPAVQTIQMYRVDSSNIQAIGHSGDTLRITFFGGKSYDYSGVSSETFTAFLNAESKGQYFRQHIQGKFSSVVVVSPP